MHYVYAICVAIYPTIQSYIARTNKAVYTNCSMM